MIEFDAYMTKSKMHENIRDLRSNEWRWLSRPAHAVFLIRGAMERYAFKQ
jgi:hypothetical protein